MSGIFIRRSEGPVKGLCVQWHGAFFAALLTGLLAACATPGIPDEPAPEPLPTLEVTEEIVPVAKPVLLPTPGLSEAERLRHAIGLLELGRSSQARVELQSYLDAVPASAIAQRLLFQIEAPLDILFPSENFTVQLKNDESLSSLSGRYHGEVLGFYGLARYNDISNPSHVTVGQTVKIPATPDAIAINEALTNPPVAEVEPQPKEEVSSWSVVEEHVEAGRYGAAIRDAEAGGLDPEGEAAATLARAYAGVARALEGTAPLLTGNRALRAGQLYLEAEQPRDALEMFELALEQTPGSTSARTFRDE